MCGLDKGFWLQNEISLLTVDYQSSNASICALLWKQTQMIQVTQDGNPQVLYNNI